MILAFIGVWVGIYCYWYGIWDLGYGYGYGYEYTNGLPTQELDVGSLDRWI
jgi:hypothetical protein